MYFTRRLSILVCLVLGAASFQPGRAQPDSPGCDGSALNLTVGTVGLSFGDSERTTGLRLNDRDRCLDTANGLNLTLWFPHETDEENGSMFEGGTVNAWPWAFPLRGVSSSGG